MDYTVNIRAIVVFLYVGTSGLDITFIFLAQGISGQGTIGKDLYKVFNKDIQSYQSYHWSDNWKLTISMDQHHDGREIERVAVQRKWDCNFHLKES